MPAYSVMCHVSLAGACARLRLRLLPSDPRTSAKAPLPDSVKSAMSDDFEARLDRTTPLTAVALSCGGVDHCSRRAVLECCPTRPKEYLSRKHQHGRAELSMRRRLACGRDSMTRVLRQES